mmetsp:Transcript_4638/g.11898  ORF Transcript_4638/g.11898 Transcript_4638/m.11898 type:complete len:402 (+) Transcript_4638:136-1341(+)|eukprot:CAMPEP_0197184548 /NCGR_PEP_ID=MMETSP1423-20130617/10080_1 /TAXON_ID=476441 /ORGANISM="Pseudo-nitzschia heimii, Strain UNC1101" /LENGTH=401 /DNA_ID=CAMNT_0042635381 /DNA_START=79 /DNA_END=1281 /DNA_ORIENTATION=+
MTIPSDAAITEEEDLGGSSSSDVAPEPSAVADASGSTDTAPSTQQPHESIGATAPSIAKEDLIELIRAVKFKNPDFSQRQVYQEIVTEIPAKFPHYADALSPNTLCLNDVKKSWKKAVLQQHKASTNNIHDKNDNKDLAERLRRMTTNPEVFTVGLNNDSDSGNESTGSNVARDYVAKYLEEQHAESSAQSRQLLEDYVHVFLDVPADSSVTKKPHQALINFQSKSSKSTTSGKGNKKKQRGKNNNSAKKKTKGSASTSPMPNSSTAAAVPFDDAIVVKIQMAAPIDANDTAKHPMLLYDQTRKYKTFVHPDGALTGSAGAAAQPESSSEATSKAATTDDTDGYSRLARWIRNEGVGGALGSSGGTKAYFYGRLTDAGKGANQRILSIYLKSLAPAEAQGW